MSAADPPFASIETFHDEMRAWELMQADDFDGAATIIAALAAKHSTWALLNQTWVEEGRAAKAIKARDYETAAALLRPLAQGGSTWALRKQVWLDEERAWREIKAHKFGAAHPLLQSLAARGSAWGMNQLGALYRDGKLGRRDLDKAIPLFEKAASLGRGAAILNLGRALVCKGNYERARATFLTGAELGNTRCMLHTGMALICPPDNEADTEAGLAWLYRAAGRERTVTHNAGSLSGRLKLYREVAWIAAIAIVAIRRADRAKV